jgi:hypothetical protein
LGLEGRLRLLRLRVQLLRYRLWHLLRPWLRSGRWVLAAQSRRYRLCRLWGLLRPWLRYRLWHLLRPLVQQDQLRQQDQSVQLRRECLAALSRQYRPSGLVDLSRHQHQQHRQVQ